jgi:hypothetical protein
MLRTQHNQKFMGAPQFNHLTQAVTINHGIMNSPNQTFYNKGYNQLQGQVPKQNQRGGYGNYDY